MGIRSMPEVHCDVCGNWMQAPEMEGRSRTDIGKFVERAGWRYYKASGWNCPECVAKRPTRTARPKREKP